MSNSFTADNLRDEARAGELEVTQAADQQTDEIMRLTKELEGVTEERDLARNSGSEAFNALVELRAHAASLEALLTVDGVDGPVKLWLPFERRSLHGDWYKGTINFCAGSVTQYRQTPAPEPELKRWRVKISLGMYGWQVITTDLMTRDLAEKIGEVIGEAE